jgi:hypothetical protein
VLSAVIEEEAEAAGEENSGLMGGKRLRQHWKSKGNVPGKWQDDNDHLRKDAGGGMLRRQKRNWRRGEEKKADIQGG